MFAGPVAWIVGLAEPARARGSDLREQQSQSQEYAEAQLLHGTSLSPRPWNRDCRRSWQLVVVEDLFSTACAARQPPTSYSTDPSWARDKRRGERVQADPETPRKSSYRPSPRLYLSGTQISPGSRCPVKVWASPSPGGRCPVRGGGSPRFMERVFCFGKLFSHRAAAAHREWSVFFSGTPPYPHWAAAAR